MVRFQLVYVAYTEHNLLDLIIPDLLFIHGVLVYVQYTELNFLYLRIADLFVHSWSTSLVKFQLVYVEYTEHNLLDLIIPDLLFVHGVLVYVQYTEINFLYLRIPDLFVHSWSTSLVKFQLVYVEYTQHILLELIYSRFIVHSWSTQKNIICCCSLTGETWTIILQRYGATTADTEFVELVCDRSYITLANLVLLKTKLGYSMRDFMYYLKRCGNDSASLILLDYDHQTESMMAANEVERKLRLLISTEQPSELMKSITPMKRPRGTTTKSRIDVPTAEEPIDAYKEWLEILQQEQPETGKLNSLPPPPSKIMYDISANIITNTLLICRI